MLLTKKNYIRFIIKTKKKPLKYVFKLDTNLKSKKTIFLVF